jgi:hypothetical protein
MSTINQMLQADNANVEEEKTESEEKVGRAMLVHRLCNTQ